MNAQFHRYRNLVYLLSLWLTTVSYADEFTVMAIRGNVQYRGRPVPLSTKLRFEDTLVLGSGGHATLAHRNGKVLEIRSPGRIALASFRTQVNTPGTTTSRKFLAYVIEELSTVEDAPELSDNHRKKMKATGAVERAQGDNVQIGDSLEKYGVQTPRSLGYIAIDDVVIDNQNDVINVISPTLSRFIQRPIQCYWYAVRGSVAPYTVSVYDAKDSLLWIGTTPDTTILIPSMLLPQGALVYWQVHHQATGASSAKYSLYHMPAETDAQIHAQITELAADIDTTTAIGQVALARLYEEEGMACYAYTAMVRALELAPDVNAYQHFMISFYRRNGMSRELRALRLEP